MRVGVLTGGGDCPGLNAVIRAVVRTGVAEHGFEFIGFRDGWRGPLEGDTMVLDVNTVRGILPRGGTILGSSRTNPDSETNSADGKSGIERVKENLDSLGVDALIAIGGEDTLGVARSCTSPEAEWSGCRRRSTTTSARRITHSASTRP
jgi:6-phosphofructokinase 1